MDAQNNLWFMKIKTLLSIVIFGLIVNAYGQKPTMQLTFTASNNGQYLPLDSILIKNLTQGSDTTLYPPDSILLLDYLTSIEGSHELSENTFSLSQNYPNPFNEQTKINLNLPENDQIKICICDIEGSELARYENTLSRGIHTFTIYSDAAKYYLLSATGKQTSHTIKLLSVSDNSEYGPKCKIVHSDFIGHMKNPKAHQSTNDFAFAPGDALRFTGYAKTPDGINGSDIIEDAPQENESYVFDVTEGVPCPGMPAVSWQGQSYNTLQIGEQCWLKENLSYEIGNSWCYDNDTSNCNIYGRLYDWETALNACPDGWHLPTDQEWNTLEGNVDSQYPVGDPEWENTEWRGLDVGHKLKSTSGWDENGNGTNLYGFGALPGGKCSSSGFFSKLGSNGYWWSSTESSEGLAWRRGFSHDYDGSFRYNNSKTFGRSVRCLMD